METTPDESRGAAALPASKALVLVPARTIRIAFRTIPNSTPCAKGTRLSAQLGAVANLGWRLLKTT